MAARKLLKEDISAEVVDLRSVVPLDIEAIIGSTRRTGRLLIVDEDYLFWSERRDHGTRHRVIDARRRAGDAAAGHTGCADSCCKTLEVAVLPTVGDIVAGAKALVAG